MRTNYQDFETIRLNMIYSYLGQKDWENTLKVCTKIFKVKALIMIEEIAPPKKTRGSFQGGSNS